MGRYSKVTGTDASGGRKPWCEPGEYWVRIVKCREHDGRNDFYFVIDMEIVEILSTSDPVKMRVGAEYSQMIKIQEDMGPVNIKRFILAANGYDWKDKENNDVVDEEDVEFVLSDAQPLEDKLMRLTCQLIQTKEKKDFTEYVWHPVEEDDDDE